MKQLIAKITAALLTKFIIGVENNLLMLFGGTCGNNFYYLNTVATVIITCPTCMDP